LLRATEVRRDPGEREARRAVVWFGLQGRREVPLCQRVGREPLVRQPEPALGARVRLPTERRLVLDDRPLVLTGGQQPITALDALARVAVAGEGQHAARDDEPPGTSGTAAERTPGHPSRIRGDGPERQARLRPTRTAVRLLVPLAQRLAREVWPQTGRRPATPGQIVGVLRGPCCSLRALRERVRRSPAIEGET